MTYYKILVPYDGSKPADKALEEAIKLAAMAKDTAEIIVLNVIPEINIPPMHEIIIDRQFLPKTAEDVTFEQHIKNVYLGMKEKSRRILEYKKHMYEQATPGITIKNVILYGYPQDNIVDYANEEKVDLIVMGNVGLSGLSKLKALGSVSRNVTERSNCSVLIVR